MSSAEDEQERLHARSLVGLARYFGRLGASGFGGPIALVGYMRRDLVEERGWYTDEEYRQALAVGRMFPGPLAAQVAMWLGYLERGGVGAPAGIVPFVLVPFLLVMAAGVVYARYQGLTVVQDVRFGVGPAVLAIIAIASYKLARATKSGAIAGVAIVIGRQTLEGPLSITIGICALALLLQPWRELPQPMLVGVAAATGLLLH